MINKKTVLTAAVVAGLVAGGISAKDVQAGQHKGKDGKASTNSCAKCGGKDGKASTDSCAKCGGKKKAAIKKAAKNKGKKPTPQEQAAPVESGDEEHPAE